MRWPWLHNSKARGPKFAVGGVITGGRRDDDAVPAFLSGCDYVLPPILARKPDHPQPRTERDLWLNP